MAETSQRMTLARAQCLADELRTELLPGCERIEIAGSIRRRKPDIGDIEIVAIPKRIGLMEDSAIDPILQRLVEEGRLHRIKNGDKYKQFTLMRAGCKFDLFLCERETWGSVFTIRTGPAEFSHRLVTLQLQGGLCPPWIRFKDGRLWKDGVAIETSEEKDVFAAIGLAWLEPWERK